MAPTQRDRRQTIVVDAKAQKRMVVRSAALPLSVLVIGAAVMLWLSDQAFTQAAEMGAEAPSFGPLVVFTILFIVGASVAAIWLGLRQSHRVAGPAYRLRKALERMGEGDFDFQVKLRDYDELTEVADELNRLIVSLRQRASSDEADATPVEFAAR